MIELEAHAAGQQRHDELIERDTLACRSSDELRMKARRAPDEDLPVGRHTADSSAYAIDRSDSACDIRRMLTSAQRREILNSEYRTVLASLTPKGTVGRLSGAQVSAAKGVARRRALKIIDTRG